MMEGDAGYIMDGGYKVVQDAGAEINPSSPQTAATHRYLLPLVQYKVQVGR